MSAAHNATVSVGLSYVAPGGANAQTVVAIQAPYDAQVEGTIDIPDTTPSATAFTLSFGSVASATALFIKNTGNQDLGIRFNADSSDQFQVPAGGTVLVAAGALAGSNPITGAKVVTTATQSGAGSCDYAVFGT